MILLRRESVLPEPSSGILSLLLTNGRLTELSVWPAESEQAAAPLNGIYVGKVMNVAKNINAAFVELTKGQRAFLPLSHAENACILNRKADGRVLAGDELLVQVEREAVKTKEPVLTMEISIAGRYAVVFPGKERGRLQFSGKLSDEERLSIARACSEAGITEEILASCSLIVRTNAAELSDCGYEPLIAEAKALLALASALWQTAGTRTCYSCLYRPESGFLTAVRDTPQEQYEEILTDDKQLYEQLHAWLERSYPEVLGRLRLYEDTSLSLASLYGLPKKLREALEKRVWLKSGGYLVIEPTEALTVIDVNSGKYTGKKGMRDTFRLINREAALEIARQLRLRNLSGIILVDFISMDNKEDERELLHLLSAELKKDPVRTAVVDMTALGLVELTRKKVRRSLYEQLKGAPAEAGSQENTP
ncbi:MAG TPA: ribonuclease E/G [Candidatus Eisenbergiella merdavium]|uniref:Ribonuclease E/G n=1 Tax=Candidatus Eisenbergiella merdavium TaxID=2838551 RepID=A0A9D2NEJ0_9FIRM|nr:ribonuclease E/G [Candidatus Eisenbergiella merdavium]